MISLPHTRFSGRIPLRKPKRKKIPVTVCIAVIYNNNAILGVADRMLTAGDIEFEPQQPKILSLTKNIVAMTAGDADVQTQLYSKTVAEVNRKIASNPTKLVSVEDVANMYRDYYSKLKVEATEREVLSPYGLTYETFILRQKEMSKDFIDEISYKIQSFSLSDVSTIITGLDELGPHIFVVDNSQVSWNDRVGFAAVGIGRYHALSHLMLARHTPSIQEAKALLTVHQAKKKSEVSPGVGSETDMFVIGPNVNTFTMLVPIPNGKDIVKDLDKFYIKYTQGIVRLDKKSESDLQVYLQQLNITASSNQEVYSTEKPISTSVPTASSAAQPPLTKVNRKRKNKTNDNKKEVSANN